MLLSTVFDGNFQVQAPGGRGGGGGRDLSECFLRSKFGGRLYLEGLIHGISKCYGRAVGDKQN